MANAEFQSRVNAHKQNALEIHDLKLLLQNLRGIKAPPCAGKGRTECPWSQTCGCEK